jgi:cyclopropane-fatty-acyl-phospholipid synthase
MTTQQETNSHSAQMCMSILQTLLRDHHPRNYAIRLWDATIWSAEQNQPTRFTIVIHHPGALRSMFLSRNELALGQAYVFPDSEPVPIHTYTRAAELEGFEIRDVESLREHYMLTLRHWVRRLEAHHDEAVKATDEATYRVWRLFMSASAYGFEAGTNNVYQSLLVKPDSGRSGLPLTRADWYRR